MHYTIDITQVAIQMIALVGTIATPILTVIGIKLAGRAAAYFHVKLSNQQQFKIADTIDNGISWLETQGDQVARKDGKIVVSDANIAKVMNDYVIPHARETLAKSGLPAQHLGELIAAKMAAKLA